MNEMAAANGEGCAVTIGYIMIDAAFSHLPHFCVHPLESAW
jgi:hypothetical protein